MLKDLCNWKLNISLFINQSISNPFITIKDMMWQVRDNWTSNIWRMHVSWWTRKIYMKTCYINELLNIECRNDITWVQRQNLFAKEESALRFYAWDMKWLYYTHKQDENRNRQIIIERWADYNLSEGSD